MHRFLLFCLLLTFSATLLHAARTFHSEPYRLLSKKSCVLQGDACRCVARVARVECCCKGSNVTTLPRNFSQNMKALYLYNTSVETIDSKFFNDYPYLEEIEIVESRFLTSVDAYSVRHLANLRKLAITGCERLEEISNVLLESNLKMQSLNLRNNGLIFMPTLAMTAQHKFDVEIDLSSNKIHYIADNKMRDVRSTSVRLDRNDIKEVAAMAFTGSSILRLNLSENAELSILSNLAFKSIMELQQLDLSKTAITELPVNGLKQLRSLRLDSVPSLKSLPSVLSFPHLEKAHFTYPHHCCLFLHVDDVTEVNGDFLYQNAKLIHARICKDMERKREKRQATENPFATMLEQLFVDMQEDESDEDMPAFSPNNVGVFRCEESVEVIDSVRKHMKDIVCQPKPDSLNPCENVVGYPLLRRAIWVVWILAIAGNLVVWVMLFLAYEKRLRLHYIFMFNLSIADLLTGVYLAFLAIEDHMTEDEYYRHAVLWQTGWGCKTAGFIAVFAAQLSIISMFLIAFEMTYNTRKAFYGGRMGFKTGLFLMFIGWIVSLFAAALPLFGISSYSTTSICLPLLVEDHLDRLYLIIGLLFNLVAFAGMAVCYVMLISMLTNPSTPSREEDKFIISKMALLVVTDLVCWFPTIFFGLTAALGRPLISLSEAKIFLVFFFPINSFANPFLYVFFTEVIQRNVKSKTLPMLRRITSAPGAAFNSLYYNSQPPSHRDDANPSNRVPPTSPRGSSCSTRITDDSYSHQYTVRSCPRVSFQDPNSPRPSVFKKSKISALPEVSDVSEHSSESQHEHNATKKSPSLMERITSFNRKKRDNNRSAGHSDSGRGSLTSTSTSHGEQAPLVDDGSSQDEAASLQANVVFSTEDSKADPRPLPSEPLH